MIKVLLVFPLLISQFCLAGYFVEKSMYTSRYIVVGRGSTRLLAEKDALSAIPKSSDELFFEPDSNFNSPAFQCSGDGFVWTEKDQCQGVDIQIVIPLRKVSR